MAERTEAHPARAVTVTGIAQHEAWQRRVLPPVERVRPGLWSIPVPIPDSPLRYTLSYAFVDDSVVLVDPGWDSPAGRRALSAGLAEAGVAIRDLTGVVVTHVHPDHHGLSGWVRQESGAWIAMHPVEARSLPGRLWRHREPGTDRAWLRDHGVPDEDVAVLAMRPERIADLARLAEPDRFLDDGDRLPATGRDVRAIWTPGHTPGHLCLHDAAAGVLLTGDHLLPRISPNIAVHGVGDDDPLSAYLDSLDRMARFDTEEALPAHEYRFADIDTRGGDLVRHHHERGAEIRRVLQRLGAPTAWAVAAELTWSRGWAGLHGMARRMALAETVAHLHHLRGIGDVVPAAGPPLRWSLPVPPAPPGSPVPPARPR
jgi:glyoxylase-like metal-dependent hydrolase (beta-lactamase superfamily II)